MRDTNKLLRLQESPGDINPAELIPVNIDYLPLPAVEAHALVLLHRRGVSLEELRGLIDVTPRQAAYLRHVTERDARRRRAVETMIDFRATVRRHFDAEVADPTIGQMVPVE